jgi:hypothetical protein
MEDAGPETLRITMHTASSMLYMPSRVPTFFLLHVVRNTRTNGKDVEGRRAKLYFENSIKTATKYRQHISGASRRRYSTCNVAWRKIGYCIGMRQVVCRAATKSPVPRGVGISHCLRRSKISCYDH